MPRTALRSAFRLPSEKDALGAALHAESDGIELVDPDRGAPRARLRVLDGQTPILALFREAEEDERGPQSEGTI